MREPIGKKLRFEVFKRDSFKCQYCGESAPAVVLVVDHLDPVKEGGGNDILNLVTACFACNSGKGARRLSDNAVAVKKIAQLEELEERRQQLEMLVEWQRGLQSLDKDGSAAAIDMWHEITPGLSLNDLGQSDMKRLVKKYGVSTVFEAMREASTKIVTSDDGNAVDSTVHEAWAHLHKMARVLHNSKTDPHAKDVAYICGTLRNRTNDWWAARGVLPDYIRSVLATGLSFEYIKGLAQIAPSCNYFHGKLEELVGKTDLVQPAPGGGRR